MDRLRQDVTGIRDILQREFTFDLRSSLILWQRLRLRSSDRHHAADSSFAIACDSTLQFLDLVANHPVNNFGLLPGTENWTSPVTIKRKLKEFLAEMLEAVPSATTGPVSASKECLIKACRLNIKIGCRKILFELNTSGRTSTIFWASSSPRWTMIMKQCAY